ncbi:MAG: membrane protein insertion efficiency factor YidD [candidate division WOR-3 bacterium]
MNSKSGIKQNSLGIKFCLLLIQFYQNTIGVILPDTCRFTPSCSHYTIEAITRFGIFKGGLMGISRILRCNPFCRGGYDPVPTIEKVGRNG